MKCISKRKFKIFQKNGQLHSVRKKRVFVNFGPRGPKCLDRLGRDRSEIRVGTIGKGTKSKANP